MSLAPAFGAIRGYELPIELAGAVFQKFVKGRSDGAFVPHAEPVEFGEGLVILQNRLVGRLKRKRRHGHGR